MHGIPFLFVLAKSAPVAPTQPDAARYSPDAATFRERAKPTMRTVRTKRVNWMKRTTRFREKTNFCTAFATKRPSPKIYTR